MWSNPGNGLLVDDDGPIFDWGTSAGNEKGRFNAVKFRRFNFIILGDAAIDGSLRYDNHLACVIEIAVDVSS